MDSLGLKAGQYYDTVEEAIDAWIHDYVAESFELGIELGSVIYYKEVDNYRVCGYTEPVVGTKANVYTDADGDWRTLDENWLVLDKRVKADIPYLPLTSLEKVKVKMNIFGIMIGRKYVSVR